MARRHLRFLGSALVLAAALAGCRDDEAATRAAAAIECVDLDGNPTGACDGGVIVRDASVPDGDGGDADDGGIDADDGGIDADDGGIDADDGGIDADDGGIDADDGGIDADDGGQDASDGDAGSDDGGMDGGSDDGGMDGGSDDGGSDDGGPGDAGDGDGGSDDGGPGDAGDGDGGSDDGGPGDAGDGDGGSDDGGMDGGSDDGGMDGGSGVDGGPPGSCPANPTCGDVHPVTGARCIPMCDGRCASTYWRWTFWVTQMNVSGTLGWGEHQGIGVLGFRYQFDARFAFNAPGAAVPPWRRSTTAGFWNKWDLWFFHNDDNSTTQFQMRTQNPGGETQDATPRSLATNLPSVSAYCGMQPLMDRSIYNHGRSLARTFASDRWYRRLIPMRWLSVIEECRNADGTACPGTTATAAPAAIDQCLTQRVTDGFCDSQCGNCSYVIPSSGAGDNEIIVAPQGAVAVRNELGRNITYTAARTGGTYTRTNVAQWECTRRNWLGVCVAEGWVWHAREDAFTHCTDKAAEGNPAMPVANPMQTLTTAMQFWQNRVLSGRWGHNSNTDADGAWRTFVGCGSTPATTVQFAPACATSCKTSMPCAIKDNSAMSWWSQTSGWHNVDDWSVGLWPGAGAPNDPNTWLSPARPTPTCKWGGFPVYGM